MKNLNRQRGEEINFVTFRKFLTSLVQKQNILGVHKNYETGYLLEIHLFTLYFKLMLQIFNRLYN